MKETEEVKQVNDRLVAMYKTLHQGVATVAVNFSKERFRAGNWVDKTTTPWKKRTDPKGTSKRRKGRATLVDTGRLRRSIRKEYSDAEVVVIATDVEYAQAHNDGFRGTVNVKAHKRNKYRKEKETYITRTGTERKRTVKKETGSGEVRAHRRRVNLPMRRFIGESAVLTAQMERYVTAQMMKAIRGGG